MNVTLYTRNGCHLCEIAENTLIAEGLMPTLVDIDSNAKLLKAFNTCVPVVEIDGKVRFRGKIDPILLQRLIINSQKS